MGDVDQLERALRSGRRFGELLSAFEKGRRFGDLVVEPRSGGQLVVSSNRIVLADAFGLAFGFSPLSRRVPRGKFPVQLSLAHVVKGKRKGDVRVACVLVKLANSQPVGFRPATAEGMRQGRILGAKYQGVEVESGTACLLDAAAAKRMQRSCQKAFERGDLDPKANRKLRERLAKSERPTCAWTALKLEDANLVAFSAGLGDGCYPAYWGYDDERRLVCLAIDLLVLPTQPSLCRVAWSGRSWRQFNYEGDRRDRFWRIKVDGRKQTVHAGVVGEEGEKREKRFATSDAAMESASRKIVGQEDRGFYEVTLVSSRLRAAKAKEKKRPSKKSSKVASKKKAPEKTAKVAKSAKKKKTAKKAPVAPKKKAPSGRLRSGSGRRAKVSGSGSGRMGSASGSGRLGKTSGSGRQTTSGSGRQKSKGSGSGRFNAPAPRKKRRW